MSEHVASCQKEILNMLVTPPENPLSAITKENALGVFSEPGRLDPLLEAIATEMRAFVPNISTATGRKEIASMAYKVAQSKTYLDGLGKQLVEQYKELPKKIDANRKTMRDFLDSLRDEIRKPLTDYEVEQDNIREAEAKAERERLDAEQAEADHEIALILNEKFDRDQADRARLIQEAQQAREAEIARTAQERAEREASNRVVEAERIAREANERAERAVIAEQKRVAELARQEQEAVDRRIANKKHQAMINTEALESLIANGIDAEQAKLAVIAIAKGKIKHIKLEY